MPRWVQPLVRIAGERKPEWPRSIQTMAAEIGRLNQEIADLKADGRRYHRAFDYLVAFIEARHGQAVAHEAARDAVGAAWNPQKK